MYVDQDEYACAYAVMHIHRSCVRGLLIDTTKIKKHNSSGLGIKMTRKHGKKIKSYRLIRRVIISTVS